MLARLAFPETNPTDGEVRQAQQLISLIQTTAEDPTKDEEQKAHGIANIPIPDFAILQASPSKLTPCMESQPN